MRWSCSYVTKVAAQRTALLGALGWLLCAAGCAEEYDFASVPISDATVIRQTSAVVAFHLVANWGGTAGEYSHCVVERDENTVKVRMVGKETSGNIVWAMVVPIEGNWSMEFDSPGAYRFEFWRGEEEPLVREIVAE